MGVVGSEERSVDASPAHEPAVSRHADRWSFRIGDFSAQSSGKSVTEVELVAGVHVGLRVFDFVVSPGVETHLGVRHRNTAHRPDHGPDLRSSGAIRLPVLAPAHILGLVLDAPVVSLVPPAARWRL